MVYRDPTPLDPEKDYTAEELAKFILEKMYGEHTREAMSRSLLKANEVAEWAREVAQQLIDGSFDEGALNTAIEQKLNDLEQEYAPQLTTIKNEVEDARGNETSLVDRLNSSDSRLAQKAKQAQVDQLQSQINGFQLNNDLSSDKDIELIAVRDNSFGENFPTATMRVNKVEHKMTDTQKFFARMGDEVRFPYEQKQDVMVFSDSEGYIWQRNKNEFISKNDTITFTDSADNDLIATIEGCKITLNGTANRRMYIVFEIDNVRFEQSYPSTTNIPDYDGNYRLMCVSDSSDVSLIVRNQSSTLGSNGPGIGGGISSSIDISGATLVTFMIEPNVVFNDDVYYLGLVKEESYMAGGEYFNNYYSQVKKVFSGEGNPVIKNNRAPYVDLINTSGTGYTNNIKNDIEYVDTNDNIIIESNNDHFYFYIKGSNESSNNYLRYTFEKYVSEEHNANGWVLQEVHAVENISGSWSILFPVVYRGEWEMAVKLKDRPDFIGTKAHGSEVNINEKFYVDGVRWTPNESKFTCKSIKIIQKSEMFDPLDEITHVANHIKEYDINVNGIELKQRIDWLVDLVTDYSYLGMLPIVRGNDNITNHQITAQTFDNYTYDEYDISNEGFSGYPLMKKHEPTEHYLYSNSTGISAKVKTVYKDKLPSSMSYIQNTTNYNKVYFSYCGLDHVVNAGDVWESLTLYELNISI